MSAASREQLYTAFDINQTPVSAMNSNDFWGFGNMVIEVLIQTGVYGTAVLNLEQSMDGVAWYAVNTTGGSAITISADGLVTDIELVKCQFIRLRPSVASGSAATVDIQVQAIL